MNDAAGGAKGRAGRARRRPGCESLEDRRLMAADPGFLLSGHQWASPAHITFSFPPDGVMWDEATNDLNATMNARFGGTGWQDQVARALQTWASVANLNVVRVNDSALPFDVPGLAQGDPRFGDIRIGGFDFNDPTTLAQTYPPPGGGLTSAGDSEINTAAPWNIGSDWDLFSVELHEMGLALGLAETPDAGTVMNADYHGVLTGLTPQDIAGIRAIYGARVPDAYQARGAGTSSGTAIDLTAGLGSTGQETVGSLSLASLGDTEYFRVVAPSSATALQVTAIANNISMLSPQVRILTSSQATLASGGNASLYGNNASATLAHLVPGQVYEIAVTGATRDVFSVGAYALKLAFTESTPPSPTPTPIPTPIPKPTPKPTPTPAPTPRPTPSPTTAQPKPTIRPDRFQPNNTLAKATPLGVVLQSTIGGLTIATPRAVEFFKFRAARAANYQVTAPGIELRLYNAAGHLLGRSYGSLLFHVPAAGTTYFIETASEGGTVVANYSLRIGAVGSAPKPAAPPVKVVAHAAIATPHPAGPAAAAKAIPR